MHVDVKNTENILLKGEEEKHKYPQYFISDSQ